LTRPKADLLQGTLDLLILKALTLGPLHGYGIIQRLWTGIVESTALRVAPRRAKFIPPLEAEGFLWLFCNHSSSLFILTNKIPTPFRHNSTGEEKPSVEAWLRVCGIAMTRLIKNSFRLRHIITFAEPLISVTKNFDLASEKRCRKR